MMGEVQSCDQVASWTIKPNGLWISVGDDWKQWCEGNDLYLHSLKVETEIILKDDANILYLSKGYELDRFSYEFVVSLKIPTTMYVDWKRVSERYQGIIIAPYQWDHRINEKSQWYYGWNCACGCIWDANAVGEIRTNYAKK